MLHHLIADGIITQWIATNQIAPARPQDDAYALFLSIGNQALQVYLWIQFAHQRFLATPSLVNNDILQMVLRSEVDIILIGVGVHARCKVNARYVQVVPPVPCHLAWSNPRHIGNAAGRRQALGHVAIQNVGIALCDDYRTPRESLTSIELRDIIGTFRGHQVQTGIAANLLFQGVGGKLCDQRITLTSYF